MIRPLFYILKVPRSILGFSSWKESQLTAVQKELSLCGKPPQRTVIQNREYWRQLRIRSGCKHLKLLSARLRPRPGRLGLRQLHIRRFSGRANNLLAKDSMLIPGIYLALLVRVDNIELYGWMNWLATRQPCTWKGQQQKTRFAWRKFNMGSPIFLRLWATLELWKYGGCRYKMAGAFYL